MVILKGTHIRTLCQKNKGSVEIKQRPINMDGRTIHRTLSSKGRPFQIWIDGWSHLWKVPRRRWISHTCPMLYYEAIAHLRFHHLDQFFMEPSDFYDAPISKGLHLIRSVQLI
jgi:hypothetical protein